MISQLLTHPAAVALAWLGCISGVVFALLVILSGWRGARRKEDPVVARGLRRAALESQRRGKLHPGRLPMERL